MFQWQIQSSIVFITTLLFICRYTMGKDKKQPPKDLKRKSPPSYLPAPESTKRRRHTRFGDNECGNKLFSNLRRQQKKVEHYLAGLDEKQINKLLGHNVANQNLKSTCHSQNIPSTTSKDDSNETGCSKISVQDMNVSKMSLHNATTTQQINVNNNIYQLNDTVPSNRCLQNSHVRNSSTTEIDNRSDTIPNIATDTTTNCIVPNIERTYANQDSFPHVTAFGTDTVPKIATNTTTDCTVSENQPTLTNQNSSTYVNVFGTDTVPEIATDTMNTKTDTVGNVDETTLTNQNSMNGNDDHINSTPGNTINTTNSSIPVDTFNHVARPSLPSPTNFTGLSSSWHSSMEYQRSVVTPLEKSMCKLYDICDKAGNARGFCDKLIQSIQFEIRNNNFDIMSTKITKRNPLVHNLSKRMKIPEPVAVPIYLESGKEVVCYSFDIEYQIQQFLLSDVWGQVENLAVPSENPWSHFADASLIGEMLNGSWARENAIDFVSKFGTAEDAQNHIQVPFIIYSDKTGVDKIEKNSLEPVMATSPLLRNAIRENHSHWFYIGLVPNLTESSSADRRLQKGKAKHRSSHVQDYHSCLRAIFHNFFELQKKKPTMQHRRGDCIQNRITSFPVACIVGDNLFHNALDARVGNASKSSTRLSRRCLTHFADATKLPHTCVHVDSFLVRKLSMGAMGSEYGNCVNREDSNYHRWSHFVTSERNTKQYQNKLRRLQKLRSRVCDKILHKVMGYHAVDNVVYDMDIGKRDNGYIDVMPADILHSIQSGIIPRILDTSIGVMSDRNKSSVDETVHTLFLSSLNRSSQKCLFPRTNFNKGFCTLTHLSAEGKTGQLFTLAILLQCWRGRNVMSSRFSTQFDQTRRACKENFNKRREQSTAHVSHQSDDDIGDDYEVSETDSVSYPVHNYLTPDTLSTEKIVHMLVKMQLGFVVEKLDPQLPAYHRKLLWEVLSETMTRSACSNLEDIHLPSNICDYKTVYNSEGTRYCGVEENVSSECEHFEMHDARRKHLSMKLTMAEFSVTIEGLLCFLSYLKYGNHKEGNQMEKQKLSRKSVVYMLKLLTLGIERDTNSNGWHLQKIIEMSHFLDDVDKYGNASGFSTNTGERGLKFWAKLPAVTAQKRSDNVFTKQVSERIVESQLFNKVSMLSNNNLFNDRRNVDSQSTERGNGIRFGGSTYLVEIKSNGIRYFHFTHSGSPVESDHSFGESIECWFKKKFSNRIRCGKSHWIKLFTEVNIDRGNNTATFRCHPNYRSGGPWFDFCMLQYEETTSGRLCTKNYLGRIGVFFSKDIQDTTENPKMLVQEIQYQSEIEKSRESPLFHHFTMQHLPPRQGMKCRSIFVEMDVNNISCPAYAIESGCENSTPFEKWCQQDYEVILVKSMMDEWPANFLRIPYFHQNLRRNVM